ncbi:Uncharacterised protein [Burkholderia pseudomallei]|nr:hypothetical protein X995_808 [Burkholderia pseudomallei B03]AIV96162.1 hypothetical protein X996_760 [Burkholderia pseudomallei A79A]CAJ9608345.1 Uncharacterised protein [Burkholderia pseudomallei]
MHILSSHNRSEFLACPQLVRFDYASGQSHFEPTLLVKGSTLLLKYVVMGVRMQMVFSRLGDRLVYGLKVFDDPEKAATLWSIVERKEELAALAALSTGEPCQVFLFNEIAVCVGWRETTINIPLSKFQMLSSGVETEAVDYSSLSQQVSALLDRPSLDDVPGNTVVIDIDGSKDWRPSINHFITNNASASSLDLFDRDEGNQQEQIGIWLTDSLHPSGSHHSPQIPKGSQTRELTDILLSYDHGSMLIESKALSIFPRDVLPSRARLAKDISGHVKKAVSQLRGGIRKIKAGVPVMNFEGETIEVERTRPMHAIVLIPDLDLIEDQHQYDSAFMAEFMEATGGFLHLLDVAELLRVVQAAEMIAARGTTTTPMMAFDYYLIERAKTALQAGSLCFEMLLRFEG